MEVLKLESINKIESLKHIISHIEVENDQIKLKITRIKKKIKDFPIENPFEFTEYAETKQKEENEVDLGFFSNKLKKTRLYTIKYP